MTMTILIILYLLYPFLSMNFRSIGNGPYEPGPTKFGNGPKTLEEHTVVELSKVKMNRISLRMFVYRKQPRP